MKVKYEANVSDYAKVLLDGAIDKIKRMLILDPWLEREVITDLTKLQAELSKPIVGTIEVEPMNWLKKYGLTSLTSQ